MTHFHNPYNFVPALPRTSVKGELGDRQPVGHHAYLDNCWTGTIAVKLTTKTPLLIPDALQPGDEREGHKTYGLRKLDDLPYLPPTSIKGMLRSAYEAVTNSRLSVFVGHEKRLFYRMNASDGLSLVPARIEQGQVRLMMGTTSQLPTWNSNRQQWQISGAMYAAWLPRYDRNTGEIANFAVRYSDGQLPEHGQQVYMWLEEYQKTSRNGRPIFKYWKVSKIARNESQLGNQPTIGRAHGSHSPTGREMIRTMGYVCITNANAQKKHDERVFFHKSNLQSNLLTLEAYVKEDWQYLIDNYKELHEGKEPDCAREWSNHITNAANVRSLQDETLCYALVEEYDGQWFVEQLYPVIIARDIFAEPPSELLDRSLRPADSVEKLSPADRVFGWVRQNDRDPQKSDDPVNAHKGQIRVHSVQCNSPDPIQRFGEQGFPLAILGQPKEQQTRFYAAQNQQGKAFADGTAKSEGYQDSSQGLRGRKVYPHHRDLPDSHWDHPECDRTQQQHNGHYHEYRRPKKDGQEQRDDQNRSIKAWVKQNQEFTFKIDVVNLSNEELGALLYLLNLPKDHYHRLGGGKPFGFGSVRLELDESETALQTGQNLRTGYESLIPVEEPNRPDWQSTIAAFRNAVIANYSRGKTFEQVSFIAAFEKAAKGLNGRVHYPRVTPEPRPKGESFEWFVKNEGQPKGRKLALPDLTSDCSLPLNPTTEQN